MFALARTRSDGTWLNTDDQESTSVGSASQVCGVWCASGLPWVVVTIGTPRAALSAGYTRCSHRDTTCSCVCWLYPMQHAVHIEYWGRHTRCDDGRALQQPTSHVCDLRAWHALLCSAVKLSKMSNLVTQLPRFVLCMGTLYGAQPYWILQ